MIALGVALLPVFILVWIAYFVGSVAEDAVEDDFEE